MKNTFKIFGIIAMVALIGLSFTACQEDEGDDGVAKKLEITDIPSTIVGKTITVAIADLKNGKQDIVALGQVTASATSTIPLLSGKDGKSGQPYTGTGSFYIIIMVDVVTPATPSNFDDDDIYVSTGTEGGTAPYPENIKNEKTTVSWKTFVKYQ